MGAYIIRRILWTIPTVLGVMLLTFALFVVALPDPAITALGKHSSPAVRKSYREKYGLDKPAWLDFTALKSGQIRKAFDSRFFRTLTFQFGKSSHYNRPVSELFLAKAPISLAIQGPVFVIELGLQLLIALYISSWRGRWPDFVVTLLSVLGMSIPIVSLYLLGQWLFGARLHWFPIAGWGVGFFNCIQYAALPILVSVFGGMGGGTRFYRTVVLEQLHSDYVRTARSKGVSRHDALLVHVLRNVLIPVLTNTVTALPGLLMGALVLERMFQIPGAGGLLVEAIFNSDSALVMAVTYFLAVVYCLLVLVTDILYTLVDPRVSLY